MGCPPGFVLESDVCTKCNNDLGHIDRALLRQFELVTFFGNVPRKRGKRPSLDSWSAITGRYTDNKPEVHINGGPGLVEAFGKTLKPVSANKEIEDVSFETSGGIATLKFSQRFGDDPKFIRALYKVAIGVTAYWLGSHVAGGSDVAAARKFVRKGRGAFNVLLFGNSSNRNHYFTPPYKGNQTPYLAVGMRIFGVDFMVDFDPEQRIIARVEGSTIEKNRKNWTILPISS